MEACRILGLNRDIFIAAGQPDPMIFELVALMADKPPVVEGLADTRNGTPRPSADQLAEVRTLATAPGRRGQGFRLRLRHRADL